MVPEGWEEHHLADVCELINGRGFKPHEWETKGYPIIRIQNLNGSDEFNYFNGEFNPKILVKNGELLFAWSGSRGTSFGPHIWNGPDAVLNYHTWRVVPKERTSRDFLVQYLRHITTEIEATAHGASALVHTQKDTMERRRCVLPPLPEQRKIADILSTWDRAIETSEALLATARTQKRALMQSMLTGKRRFPEFEGQEWQEMRLGDVCVPKQWPTISQKEMTDAGYPVFGANGFIGFYDRYNHAEATTVVTCRGATCGNVSRTPAETYITGNAMSLDDVDVTAANQEFLYQLLSRRGFDDIISGSAQPQIIGKDIRAVKITLPGVQEQMAIAGILSTIDDEIGNFIDQIEGLRKEKNALMQQLLTGKRRVKV